MHYSNIFYVLASILFILGIKKLSHPKTARNGNFIAASGMLIAILATLLSYGKIDLQMIFIGMIIGAIIGMVRRIRRGAKSDNNYLEITNGLLNLAQLKWEEYEYKVKKGVLPEPDYNVMPNENLNLLIRYQELLNIGKRGYPIERISGDNPPRTDLKRQLEEYVKDLGGADYFFTKDILLSVK
mgnify:CR=1 FL=1